MIDQKPAYSLLRQSLTVLGLLIICLAALWFRYPRIEEGMPFFYREDEAHHYNRLINMVKTGDLNPNYFHKPSLHFYLRIPAVAAAFIWNVRQGHIQSVKEINTRDPYGVAGYAFSSSHPGITKWNRAFSVLLSLLCVILTFSLAKELSRSAAAGLVAAALVAVSPSLIADSAVIGVDVVMSFFCLLSVYCAVRLVKNFSLPLLTLTGLLCGLAISSKYNALPIALVPLVACLVQRRHQIAPVFLALSAPFAGFLLGSPYIVSSLPLFLDQLAYEVWHYGIAAHEGHHAEPGVVQAFFYLKWLNNEALGPVATAFGTVGVVLFAAGNRKANLVFLLFPLLFAALMISQRTNFTRNMLVIVPFISIIGAVAISTVSDLPRFGKISRLVLNTLFLLAAGFFPLSMALEQRQAAVSASDTRSQAGAWLLEHEQPFLDSTVQAQLQMPLQTLRLRGVSRIDLEKSSPSALYLSGFDRLVVSREWPISALEKQFLAFERSFSGVNQIERIVVNPTVDLYSFRLSGQFEAFLETFIKDKPEYELSLQLTPIEGGLQWKAGSQMEEAVRFENAEDYYWVQSRLTRVILTGWPQAAPRLAGAATARLTLQAMTPWPGQELFLGLPGWSFSAKLQPGPWQELQMSVPLETLRQLPLELKINRVHSPLTQGLSSDARRLGLALQSIKIEPEAG